MKTQAFLNRAKSAFAAAKRPVAKVGVVASGLVSAGAFAIDDTAVTAAYTAGNTSVSNATTGMIALVAIIVGVTLVISLMRKV